MSEGDSFDVSTTRQLHGLLWFGAVVYGVHACLLYTDGTVETEKLR